MTSEQQTISLAEAKTIANGVLAAERGYVRPDELSEVLFFCDVCETVITPPKTRFCCIECDSFDLCSDCYQRAEPIPGGPPGENYAQSHLRAVHADFVADFVDVAQPVAFAEPLLYRDDNGQAAVAVPILPPLWRPSSGQQEDAGQRPQRLFRCFVAEPTFQLQFDNDCLSLAATFEPVFVHYAQRPCWGARQRLWDADGSPPTLGDYAWLTFNDVHRLSRQFAAGLLALLDAPAAGQIVGLLSGEELLEKHVADVAVMAWCGGLVSSPINASCSDAELLSVVQLIRTPCLVVAERLFDRLAALLQRHAVPLQLLVVLPNHDLAPDRRYRTDAYPPTPAAQVRRYDDVLALGRRCAGAAAAARGDDVATITWTSGSTGRPKGVTVTQAVWSQTFRHGASKQPVSYAYSYSDRRNTLLGMCTGGRTGFCSGSAASILDDLQRLSPSLLASTPRLFNTVYNDYKEALALRGGDSGVLADYAHIFGRRLKTIVCGGAPPSDAVWTFLQQCFPHCTLTNTYAATECGSIAVNGRLVCQRWRLLDWGDYKSSDVPPRGELAVWTERAAATAYFGSDAAALNSDAWTDDGYYRTGDIVELIGADTIRIVDRKKNLFKLQNGEFVSPERVEAVLLRSRAVDQLCVVGSPHCDFVVAVVVASQSAAAAASPQQIVDDLLAVGVSAQLRSFEIPRGVVVAQAPFAPDNGQLTDGGKLLRHNIVAHYADQLQALTEALSERRSSCSSASDPAALLAELVCEALDRRRADIDDDQDLTKLGLTSIGATRILRTVERHFGVKLSLHALFQHATLRRLTALVLPQQTDPADSTSSGEDIDWLAEMQLPDDVLPLAGGQVSCDGHVLLTGATGFLGAFVLEQLLQRWPSTVKIYCLIRGSEPQQRLIEHLRKLGVCDEQTDWSARLCFVNGALDARLGLAAADDDYDALAGQIGVVYHCAAHVNSVLPYAVLKPANVDGTLHVLRFAAHVRAKHVNVVSTLSVLVGYSVIGRLESSLLSAHVPYLRHAGGYTQSKFVADALCLAAKQRGFSVTVFRPGMISADSRSGVSNLQDFDSRLLAGIVKLGAAPFPVQAAFDQTPVNWVAQTIAALGQQPSGSGEGVYHLSNPLGSMDFGQVVLTLVSLGYSLLLVDYQLWLAEHLAALDTDNPIFPLVDAYFAGRTTFPPRRSAAPEELVNTTAAVQRLGLEPPPTVDRQLLARQMAWLAAQYQLPAPVLTGSNQ